MPLFCTWGNGISERPGNGSEVLGGQSEARARVQPQVPAKAQSASRTPASFLLSSLLDKRPLLLLGLQQGFREVSEQLEDIFWGV